MAVCQRVTGYRERRRGKGGKMEFRSCHLAAIQEEAGKWSKGGEERVNVEVYEWKRGRWEGAVERQEGMIEKRKSKVLPFWRAGRHVCARE